MVNDCGFVIVIDTTYRATYYKDTGQMALEHEEMLTPEDVEKLTEILNRGGFVNLESAIPHADSRRGGKTLTIMSRMGVRDPHTVTVFMDETNYAFPEGFLAFDQELRAFLLGKLGVETGMYLDRTPRNF